MKRIYVSGPMTGYKNFNYDAFFAAEERLKARGYKVCNPARNQVCATWHDYLRLDIKQMMDCQAIYLLRGWEASHGSRVEFWLAESLEFEIMYEEPAAALGELLGEVGRKEVEVRPEVINEIRPEDK